MAEPRVGIGLPVRNGARFLEAGLEALLAQSFADFAVVVCDNASTDGTLEIAHAVARRDARVRVHAGDRDLGAAANFNRAFELTKSPYFKWAAHDDLHEERYLEECVAVLDADPSAVSCHSLVRFVDAEGRVLGDHEPRLTALDSDSVVARFRDLTSLRHWCFDVFGVMRREVLERTPRIAPYVGSDRNLLVELGLHGRLRRVPEPLFLSRDHGERSIRTLARLRDRAGWFDPALAGKRVYPHWRHLREYARSLGRARLSVGEKLACYASLLGWMRRFRSELLDDVTHGDTGRGTRVEESGRA